MPLTVLIVDDSKLARIVAGKALAQLHPDWRKIEAGSGPQALELLQDTPADIALVDFNMEPQDGLALASEVRAAYPDMPIAIITANIQDEIVARAREIGAAFIAKPLTSEGLAAFLSGAVLKLRAGKE